MTVWIMPRPRYGALLSEGIAHDVEIGVARQAEAGAERGAAGFFDVDQDLGGVVEAHAGVERHHAGGGLLVVRAEAMRAAVERGEIGMGLKNEIGLPGEPEARVLEMREHGFVLASSAGGGRRRGVVAGEAAGSAGRPEVSGCWADAGPARAARAQKAEAGEQYWQRN